MAIANTGDTQPAAATTTAAAPTAQSTYYEFAIDVLKGLGEPVTPSNVDFILAWAKREGGGGAWNPLNTTLKHGTSTPLAGNSAGVQNYSSFQDGVAATIQTLQSPLYKDIRNAFSTGKADPNATYAGLATWSGGGYQNLTGVDGTDWAHQAVSANPAGGGGTGAGAPSAAPKAAALSPSALEAGLSQDGFVIGLIDSTPELKNVFTSALSHNWSVEQTMLHIQNTGWFRHHTAAQRQFLELQHSDPAQLNRKIQQTAADLTTLATQLGVPINNINALAHSVVYNGLDSQEQTKAIAQGFKYRGQGLTGQAGADVDSLKQLSKQYYSNMTNDQFTNLTQRMLMGQLNPQDVTDLFKQQAISMFPHLKDQLDRGLTVMDVAQPYMQEMANLFEKPANGINERDPMVMKALQQSTPKGTQLMPLWQFQQMVKQDPRWLQTNNARESMMGITTNLLSSMGLISGGVSVGAPPPVTSAAGSVGSVNG